MHALAAAVGNENKESPELLPPVQAIQQADYARLPQVVLQQVVLLQVVLQQVVLQQMVLQ